MARRGRSTRSYVLEFALVAALIAVLYFWMTNGGPSAFGKWFADYLGAP